MSRFFRFLALNLVGLVGAFAASGLPSSNGSIAPVSLSEGAPSTSIDLKNYFSVPGISGSVAQFVTTSGVINVELLASDAPKNVANFTTYVTSKTYDNTIIHRSAPLSNSSVAIIQGGGYFASLPVTHVAVNSPVPLEYKVANARGTLAAARTNDINSATSEWYFNVQDNSTVLGPANNSGYTVFGRIIGTGLSVIDAIAKIPTYNVNLGTNGSFPTIPLIDIQPNQTQLYFSNLVVISSVRIVPLFPSSSTEPSVVTFSASSSNPAVAVASIDGSKLSVTAATDGTTDISVTATDSNGNTATSSFAVTVSGFVVKSAPSFSISPREVSLPAGSYTVLTAAALGSPAPSYQWYRKGAAIAGATKSDFTITSLSTADVGEYHVVATNELGSATSSSGAVAVASGSSVLANLSVRAAVSPLYQLIVGFSSNAAKTVLVRGVGPGLAKYGVADVFADPRLELYSGSTIANQNDNWDASLSSVFKQLGAFDLDTNSKDTALQHTINGAYTAQLKGSGSGIALVEVYDSGSAQPTRLGNVSALYVSGSGDNVLIAGFTISGSVAKTLLIRGVGPKLAEYGVTGVLENPKLSLFSGSTLIGENDDWDSSIATVSASTGAFALNPGSKDAAFLVTLAPGQYTVQVSGPAAGEALIEVYELP